MTTVDTTSKDDTLTLVCLADGAEVRVPFSAAAQESELVRTLLDDAKEVAPRLDVHKLGEATAAAFGGFLQLEGQPAAPGAQPTAATTWSEAPVVALKGLVGGAEHNGQQANVLDFVADRGRFKVQLLQAGGGQQLRVKPANIEVVAVPVGLAVGVGGLVGAAQHNGKRGTVASGPDPISGRYKVRLDGEGNGGRPLGLLPANLRLLGPRGFKLEPAASFEPNEYPPD